MKKELLIKIYSVKAVIRGNVIFILSIDKFISLKFPALMSKKGFESDSTSLMCPETS